jgi:hypothetical protein
MGHAIAVNPMDAQSRMDLGRFFAWHAARQRTGSPRAEIYQNLAADRFAEAVLVRPTWGYAWALLAEQWLASGQSLERVVYALRHALTMSPREPVVQLKSLWLGLGYWSVLDTPMRQQLAASLKRLTGQREYFDAAARIALHHAKSSLLAGNFEHAWQHAALARLQRVRNES